jgi:hypothetical protein
MSRLSALPQGPYQRQCASSTHIRDRTHGMVREASTCSGLSRGMVEIAIIDLLTDKLYMNASAPRPPVEDTKTPPTTATRKTRDRYNNRLRQIDPNSFTPIRSYTQSRQDLSRSSEPEPDVHPPASGNGQQTISINRTAKASPYGKRTASLSEASTCWNNSTFTCRPTTTITRHESRHSIAC